MHYLPRFLIVKRKIQGLNNQPRIQICKRTVKKTTVTTTMDQNSYLVVCGTSIDDKDVDISPELVNYKLQFNTEIENENSQAWEQQQNNSEEELNINIKDIINKIPDYSHDNIDAIFAKNDTKLYRVVAELKLRQNKGSGYIVLEVASLLKNQASKFILLMRAKRANPTYGTITRNGFHDPIIKSRIGVDNYVVTVYDKNPILSNDAKCTGNRNDLWNAKEGFKPILNGKKMKVPIKPAVQLPGKTLKSLLQDSDLTENIKEYPNFQGGKNGVPVIGLPAKKELDIINSKQPDPALADYYLSQSPELFQTKIAPKVFANSIDEFRKLLISKSLKPDQIDRIIGNVSTSLYEDIGWCPDVSDLCLKKDDLQNIETFISVDVDQTVAHFKQLHCNEDIYDQDEDIFLNNLYQQLENSDVFGKSAAKVSISENKFNEANPDMCNISKRGGHTYMDLYQRKPFIVFLSYGSAEGEVFKVSASTSRISRKDVKKLAWECTLDVAFWLDLNKKAGANQVILEGIRNKVTSAAAYSVPFGHVFTVMCAMFFSYRLYHQNKQLKIQLVFETYNSKKLYNTENVNLNQVDENLIYDNICENMTDYAPFYIQRLYSFLFQYLKEDVKNCEFIWGIGCNTKSHMLVKGIKKPLMTIINSQKPLWHVAEGSDPASCFSADDDIVYNVDKEEMNPADSEDEVVVEEDYVMDDDDINILTSSETSTSQNNTNKSCITSKTVYNQKIPFIPLQKQHRYIEIFPLGAGNLPIQMCSTNLTCKSNTTLNETILKSLKNDLQTNLKRVQQYMPPFHDALGEYGVAGKDKLSNQCSNLNDVLFTDNKNKNKNFDENAHINIEKLCQKWNKFTDVADKNIKSIKDNGAVGRIEIAVSCNNLLLFSKNCNVSDVVTTELQEQLRKGIEDVVYLVRTFKKHYDPEIWYTILNFFVLGLKARADIVGTLYVNNSAVDAHTEIPDLIRDFNATIKFFYSGKNFIKEPKKSNQRLSLIGERSIMGKLCKVAKKQCNENMKINSYNQFPVFCEMLGYKNLFPIPIYALSLQKDYSTTNVEEGCACSKCFAIFTTREISTLLTTHTCTAVPKDRRSIPLKGAVFKKHHESLTNSLKGAQLEVVTQATSNSRSHLLVIGPAGTGKSTVLHVLIERFTMLWGVQSCLVVVSALKTAADLLNGITLHSLMGLTKDHYLEELLDCNKIKVHVAAQFSKNKEKMIYIRSNLRTLIIDECGLVGSVWLDLLDLWLKELKRGVHKDSELLPFGGVQIILCGDPLQNGPLDNVNPDYEKKDPMYPYMFFEASSFTNATFMVVYLRDVHRNDHKEFNRIISLARLGKQFITQEECNWLMQNTGANVSYNQIKNLLRTLANQCTKELRDNPKMTSKVKSMYLCPKNIHQTGELGLEKYMKDLCTEIEKRPCKHNDDNAGAKGLATVISCEHTEGRAITDAYIEEMSQSELPMYTFKATDTSSTFDNIAYVKRATLLTTETKFEPILKFRVGMQVAFVSNNVSANVSNNSRGIIVNIDEANGIITVLPSCKDGECSTPIEVRRITQSVNFNKVQDAFSRTQFPIVPSIGGTTHSVQGQTFYCPIILNMQRLGKNGKVVSIGIAYQGSSRCSDPINLYFLHEISPDHFQAHPRAVKFDRHCYQLAKPSFLLGIKKWDKGIAQCNLCAKDTLNTECALCIGSMERLASINRVWVLEEESQRQKAAECLDKTKTIAKQNLVDLTSKGKDVRDIINLSDAANSDEESEEGMTFKGKKNPKANKALSTPQHESARKRKDIDYSSESYFDDCFGDHGGGFKYNDGFAERVHHEQDPYGTSSNRDHLPVVDHRGRSSLGLKHGSIPVAPASSIKKSRNESDVKVKCESHPSSIKKKKNEIIAFENSLLVKVFDIKKFIPNLQATDSVRKPRQANVDLRDKYLLNLQAAVKEYRWETQFHANPYSIRARTTAGKLLGDDFNEEIKAAAHPDEVTGRYCNYKYSEEPLTCTQVHDRLRFLNKRGEIAKVISYEELFEDTSGNVYRFFEDKNNYDGSDHPYAEYFWYSEKALKLNKGIVDDLSDNGDFNENFRGNYDESDEEVSHLSSLSASKQLSNIEVKAQSLKRKFLAVEDDAKRKRGFIGRKIMMKCKSIIYYGKVTDYQPAQINLTEKFIINFDGEDIDEVMRLEEVKLYMKLYDEKEAENPFFIGRKIMQRVKNECHMGTIVGHQPAQDNSTEKFIIKYDSEDEKQEMSLAEVKFYMQE